MEKVFIETERLQIKQLTIQDLTAFHSYRSNPEVTKYQGFDVMTKQQAKLFIKLNATKQFGNTDGWIQYAIKIKATQQLIGDCAIKLISHKNKSAEIGITIMPTEQMKGYAKEAMLGIMDFLFTTKHVHRIVEIVDTENIASIHLLQSIGFRQEGHFIENIFFKGKWGSEFLFAMLKREWDNKK